MAKKLYGAAKLAHERKMGRTAIVVAAPSKPARRRKRRAPSKPARRRRRALGGSVGGVRPLRAQTWDLGAAIGYGWVTKADNDTAAKVRAYVNKVPTLDALGAPLSHGLILHFIARNTGGKVRKIAGHLSHAALMRAAYNFGAAGFDHKDAAALGGADDDDAWSSGAIDDSDVGYDDDPGDE